MKSSYALSAALLSLAVALPTEVVKRGDSCGQYNSVSTGSYTVYNNVWGESAASSGSECFGVDGMSGDTVKWHTRWVRSKLFGSFSQANQHSAGHGKVARTVSSE